MSQLTHTATLARGKTYYLGNKRFERGVPVPVSDDEMAVLEDDAVHLTLSSGDGVEEIVKARFTFDVRDAEAEPEPTQARKRAREAKPAKSDPDEAQPAPTPASTGAPTPAAEG